MTLLLLKILFAPIIITACTLPLPISITVPMQPSVCLKELLSVRSHLQHSSLSWVTIADAGIAFSFLLAIAAALLLQFFLYKLKVYKFNSDRILNKTTIY